MKQLRIYFNSLDDDGGGSIGTDELEDPLIALGLLDTRAQVEKIVMAVDDDGSGMLEFSEFLQIIKGGTDTSSPPENQDKNDKGSGAVDGADAIYNFFKDLTQGVRKGEDGANNEHIPFSLYISEQRRKMILNSMGVPRYKLGEKVLPDEHKLIG